MEGNNMDLAAVPGLLTGFWIFIFIVMIPISALALWLTGKMFSIKNNKYTKALLAAFIVYLFQAVLLLLILVLPARSSESRFLLAALMVVSMPLVGLFAFFTVKFIYGMKWGKTALVWLLWSVLNYVAGFFISLIGYLIVFVFMLLVV